MVDDHPMRIQPPCSPHAHHLLTSQSLHIYRITHVSLVSPIRSRQGVEQGDPPGPMGFAASLRGMSRAQTHRVPIRQPFRRPHDGFSTDSPSFSGALAQWVGVLVEVSFPFFPTGTVAHHVEATPGLKSSRCRSRGVDERPHLSQSGAWSRSHAAGRGRCGEKWRYG